MTKMKAYVAYIEVAAELSVIVVAVKVLQTSDGTTVHIR